MIDRTQGRQLIHDLGPPTEGSDRKTTANNLAEATQVRREPEHALGTGWTQSESGHHLVGDEHAPVISGQLPEELQVAGLGQIQPSIGRHQFKDHCRQLTVMLLENPPQRLRIIKGKNEGLTRDIRRHARTVWTSQSERTGTCLHEQPIRVPVIAAIKFDNEVPPGKSTSQADGRHGRLSTAVAETHLLHRWHQRFDALSHRHLLRVRNAKAGTALSGALNCSNNG